MNSLRNLHSVCRFSLRTLSTKEQTKPAFNFKLADGVSEAIASGKLKRRHHPGSLGVGTVTLPDELNQAVLTYLSSTEYSEKHLETDGKILSTRLWSRHKPLEDDQLRQKIATIEAKIVEKETIDLNAPEIREEVRKRLLDSRMSKMHERMKREIYNWKPFQYDKYMSAVYMLARLVPDYAALVKILSEIRSRDPAFVPLAMLDFGSGVGSGMWAVDGVWADLCKEAVCVDASSDMNNLADTLLRRGDPENPRQVRGGGTFFRQFLPMSDALRYNLVLSSRSLLELPDIDTRLKIIDILWRKTSGYLVIVEAGTSAGFKIVQEARDYVLNLTQTTGEEEVACGDGHVFSPCPHDKICQRFDISRIPLCNFSVNYKPLTLTKNQNPTSDKFSYVIIKRGVRQQNHQEEWPRLIQQPLLRKRHAICRTCTSYGRLTELISTKRRHGSECYRVCKYSNWGDRLPVVLPEPTETPELDQSEDDLSENDESDQKKEIL
ncbi:hypothetical protein Pcinc_035778 [Petrolisthes cinctipes]|uniref:Methyltransferase-like protein 17, mitochondrial n=1 Tax=Petrolisthes cinctipes TaxID=88211 RepID=A0AAE1EMZ1_PETCI|nr:hypothetical protein Pcinc_035778 [Petrolisthes cinctipes]